MRILRQRQVCEKVGLSPMTIWRRQRSGTFPRRVQLGPNSVGWPEDEIEAWCLARVAERDQRVGRHVPKSAAAEQQSPGDRQ